MSSDPAPEPKVAAEDPAQEESILKRRKKKKKDEKKELTPSEELVAQLESQCAGYLSLWRAASLGDLKAVQRALSLHHYSAHTAAAAAAATARARPTSSTAATGATEAPSARLAGMLSSNRRGSGGSFGDHDGGLPQQQQLGRGGHAAGAAAAPTSMDDAPAEAGVTPLVAAITGDHGAVVEFLLSARADPSRACPAAVGGATPLGTAAKIPDGVRCLEALLEAGALVDGTDAAGNTPLMYAARSGNLRAVELLLNKGANLHAGNKRGMTAVMFASLFARTAILEQLHAREASSAAASSANASGSVMNATDARGNTPLHVAALCGHSKLVAALVQGLGAQGSVRNAEGKTAADVAVDKATFNAIIGRT